MRNNKIIKNKKFYTQTRLNNIKYLENIFHLLGKQYIKKHYTSIYLLEQDIKNFEQAFKKITNLSIDLSANPFILYPLIKKNIDKQYIYLKNIKFLKKDNYSKYYLSLQPSPEAQLSICMFMHPLLGKIKYSRDTNKGSDKPLIIELNKEEIFMMPQIIQQITKYIKNSIKRLLQVSMSKRQDFYSIIFNFYKEPLNLLQQDKLTKFLKLMDIEIEPVSEKRIETYLNDASGKLNYLIRLKIKNRFKVKVKNIPQNKAENIYSFIYDKFYHVSAQYAAATTADNVLILEDNIKRTKTKNTKNGLYFSFEINTIKILHLYKEGNNNVNLEYEKVIKQYVKDNNDVINTYAKNIIEVILKNLKKQITNEISNEL